MNKQQQVYEALFGSKATMWTDDGMTGWTYTTYYVSGLNIHSTTGNYSQCEMWAREFLDKHPNGYVYRKSGTNKTVCLIRKRKGAHAGVYRTTKLDDWPPVIRTLEMIGG